MKNKILVLALLITCLISCKSENVWEEFEDPIFITFLHDDFDIPLTDNGRIDLDDEATLRALGKITRLDLNGTKVINLSGINNLVSLTNLECNYNRLTSLNVNGLRNLITIYCRSNNLQSLKIEDCGKLYWLDCSNNKLTSLSIKSAPDMNRLYCFHNQLKELDASGFGKLEDLGCGVQTDQNGEVRILSLTVTAEQENSWINKWKTSPNNGNVEVK